MNIRNVTRRGALALAIVMTSLLPAASHATVGGPTYIYSFTYNPANESVYFIRNSEGGKGCPPELWKMSVTTGKKDFALSCDQAFALLKPNAEDATPIYTAINNIVQGFKDLEPIHLPKNGIAIDVDFVKSEKWSPEDDGITRSHFIAKVFQGATKIAEIPIVGCDADQPFVFAGYAVPGLEKRIVLLLSAKGDCFEGGYTNETLYPVGNISRLDRAPVSGSWKSPGPLVPSAATLVVFERDRVPASTTPTDNTTATSATTTPVAAPANPDNAPYSFVPLLVAGLIGTIIGLILGALVFKARSNTTAPTAGTI